MLRKKPLKNPLNKYHTQIQNMFIINVLPNKLPIISKQNLINHRKGSKCRKWIYKLKKDKKKQNTRKCVTFCKVKVNHIIFVI